MRISHDKNGNKTLLVKVEGQRGFSIQTLGNLPETHRYGVNPSTKGEVFSFIAEHGTKRQKELLQTNKPFNLQNVKSKRLDYNEYWRELSESDIDEITALLCIGCSHNTYKRVWHALYNINSARPAWYLERIMYDGERWSYCAGQDYISERATIRKELMR